MLEEALRAWGGQRDLWVFGYASLIWNPEFDYDQRIAARIHGWHRSLRMWSHIYRGTREQPGLVCALLSGGCCDGVAFRIPRRQAGEALERLWRREMPSGVYDPRWVRCPAAGGEALTFTLDRNSPNYAGDLTPAQLRTVFEHSRGLYGTTLDYVRQTHQGLLSEGIHDRKLEALLAHAPA